MPLSVPITRLPCPNSLAELALAGSMSGRTEWILRPEAMGSSLRQFWSASRKLQHGWQSDLAEIQADISQDSDRFERVALEVLLTELLTRVWATNWSEFCGMLRHESG